MPNDEAERRPSADDGGDPSDASGSDSGSGTGPEMDRLPPPAFPPGSRRSSAPRAEAVGVEKGGAAGEAGREFPDDAFISPDEPIRRTARGVPEDAFISPDDPIPVRHDEEEGKVTGVGETPKEFRSGRTTRDDRPTIHELPYLLDSLAEKINQSGERAIQAHPDKGHFEASLCAFLRGYLSGSEE